MKAYLILFLLFSIYAAKAQTYTLPDSLGATGVYFEMQVSAKQQKINVKINNVLNLKIESVSKGMLTQFKVFSSLKPKNINIKTVQSQYGFWQIDSATAVYINSVFDSAGKRNLTAIYTQNTNSKKWRLHNQILSKQKLSFNNISIVGNVNISNAWYQSKAGFKKLDSAAIIKPILRPYSNADSATTASSEISFLTERLKDSSVIFYKNIFYKVIDDTKNGNKINVTDTLTVFYKGWLLSNSKVFDQTVTKPINFPLNALIPGWQTALSQCNVGNKVRIWLPSGQAYGIRNLGTDIPPNSILVFDIEVEAAKNKL
jgi:FKBP-type peptidyl-prolyl cis-trans isomerase FkpA